MSFQKKLEINTIKKLIDINGEIVNFEADFLVQSENLNPFYFIIADQDLLDQDKELEFKQVEEGSISGKISFEKNVHTNYYMVIKADQPMIIFAQVNIKELPMKKEMTEKLAGNNGQIKKVRFADQLNDKMVRNTANAVNAKNDYGNIFKLIAVLAILIIGGFLMYKFYTEKDKAVSLSYNFQE